MEALLQCHSLRQKVLFVFQRTVKQVLFGVICLFVRTFYYTISLLKLPSGILYIRGVAPLGQPLLCEALVDGTQFAAQTRLAPCNITYFPAVDSYLWQQQQSGGCFCSWKCGLCLCIYVCLSLSLSFFRANQQVGSGSKITKGVASWVRLFA